MNPVHQADIESLLPAWIGKQRWFSKGRSAPAKARVIDHDWFGDDWPRLWWTIVEVDGQAEYQVPIGLQKVADIGGTLLGHEQALIGHAEVDGESVVVYDALVDSELGCRLLDVICDGTQEAKSVRPVGAEQSNTSLVFDNRLIVKFFRRLHTGPNPDLEVTKRLSDADFSHVAPVVATWERGEHDLAVCQPYLRDGTDGWKLALASVRDYLGPRSTGGSATAGSPALQVEEVEPGDAGGDFANEARRLGEMTALLHLAMARVLPMSDFDPKVLVKSLERGRSILSQPQAARLDLLIGALRALAPGQAGKSTRVHGDYHLGQTLRAVTGWYVFDFEGEPARPLSERTEPTSPLKDVACMARSFHYAAAAGVAEQMPTDRAALADQARAWEQRNREAFVEGYLRSDGLDRTLPADPKTLELVSRGFEVEKAIYELGYEKAYRPDWVQIPSEAIERLLD